MGICLDCLGFRVLEVSFGEGIHGLGFHGLGCFRDQGVGVNVWGFGIFYVTPGASGNSEMQVLHVCYRTAMRGLAFAGAYEDCDQCA